MNAEIIIDKNKLEIYNLFEGDVDVFERSGNNEIKIMITHRDYYLISELLSDLHIITRGLASEVFKLSFRQKIVAGSEKERDAIIGEIQAVLNSPWCCQQLGNLP